jgi:hypothetical protein
MGDIRTLLKEIFKAEPAYKKAKRYSDGTISEVWANPKIAKVLGKSAGRYGVNIARRPIDAVLDRLEITQVSVVDDDPATEILNTEVWDTNELDLELPDALDLAETYGDAYLVEWPRPDDEGGGVDVFINDPVGMRLIYDPENPRRKVFGGRTWLDSEGYRRVTLWYKGPRVERWISKTKQDTGKDLEPRDEDYIPFLPDDGDDDSWFEDLELGLDVPVHHLRTARPYGKPEHLSVYGTQNMLTKQVATMMDATDGWGFPFRAALTKSGTVGPPPKLDDGDWDDEDGDTPTTAPTAPRSDPGTIARLPDVDALVQLEPADVGNFLDPISMTMRLSSTVSNTPLSYFDPSAASASGESKKEHEKPAVNKANKRLRGYESTIRDALEYALALIGQPDKKVMITWAPTESVDDQAEVDLARNRQDAGVPAKVALTQLGYPEKEVEEWVNAATPDDQLLERRVRLLKEFAAAAAQLGTAATLGVVDPAAAQQMILGFLPGQITEPPEPEPETVPGTQS